MKSVIRKITLILFFHSITVFSERMKRHLIFNEGSKLFLSIDIRDNLFDYSDFFASAIGFKIAWNLPSNVVKENRRSIRQVEVHNGIQLLLDEYHLNGTSCLQKFICEAQNHLPKSDHIMAQILEILFALGTRKYYVYVNMLGNRFRPFYQVPSDSHLLFEIFLRDEGYISGGANSMKDSVSIQKNCQMNAFDCPFSLLDAFLPQLYN